MVTPEQPNRAIDGDTYLAPLRAPFSARHCERYAATKASRQHETLLLDMLSE